MCIPIIQTTTSTALQDRACNSHLNLVSPCKTSAQMRHAHYFCAIAVSCAACFAVLQRCMTGTQSATGAASTPARQTEPVCVSLKALCDRSETLNIGLKYLVTQQSYLLLLAPSATLRPSSSSPWHASPHAPWHTPTHAPHASHASHTTTTHAPHCCRS